MTSPRYMRRRIGTRLLVLALIACALWLMFDATRRVPRVHEVPQRPLMATQ